MYESTSEHMKFILGTKQNMTTYFAEDGTAIPVTLVTAGPVVVSQVKTQELDGYNALQFAYSPIKESRMNKPRAGHMHDLAPMRTLREVRLTEAGEMKRGDTVTADTFVAGDIVAVTGTSKGKGFQGVVKRHGFSGGRRSHGQKHSEREPGSIGGGLRNRVPKGMRMAGRMGSDTVTVENLVVVAVEPETGTLLIKGALPGSRGSIVEIKSK